MPLTKRQEMKRIARQAAAAIERSAAYLLQLRQIYAEADAQGSIGSAERVQALDYLLSAHANMFALIKEFEENI